MKKSFAKSSEQTCDKTGTPCLSSSRPARANSCLSAVLWIRSPGSTVLHPCAPRTLMSSHQSLPRRVSRNPPRNSKQQGTGQSAERRAGRAVGTSSPEPASTFYTNTELQYRPIVLSCNGPRFHDRSAARFYLSGTCIKWLPAQCLRSVVDRPHTSHTSHHAHHEHTTHTQSLFLTPSWAMSRHSSTSKARPRQEASPCRPAHYESPDPAGRSGPRPEQPCGPSGMRRGSATTRNTNTASAEASTTTS